MLRANFKSLNQLPQPLDHRSFENQILDHFVFHNFRLQVVECYHIAF